MAAGLQLGNTGNTGNTTGLRAGELTTPYCALRDAGLDVVLESPLGGTLPFSAKSVNLVVQDNQGSVKRFLLGAWAAEGV